METEVLIIGGGATGLGLAWDLALRGINTVLIEQGDFGHGTSTRFHGLLHSGGRYAVKDPVSAQECIQENMTLKRVAAPCIEDTGGWFVHLSTDDPDYPGRWVTACRKTGIPVQERPVQEVLDLVPALNPAIDQAFFVPDAAINGFRLLHALAYSARQRGARLMTYTRAVSLVQKGGRVVGAVTEDQRSGQRQEIRASLIVNTPGPWAAEVAAMAGIRVGMRLDKGSLLIFNHRLSGQVINRLRSPGDADILVPAGTVSILGTTSVPVESPDNPTPSAGELLHMLALGEELFPHLHDYRVIRAFAGVRPLYDPAEGQGSAGREVSRTFSLLDHAVRDGLEGLVSVVGGKLTTFRLMAEKTGDLVVQKLGVGASSKTAITPLSLPERRPVSVFMPVRGRGDIKSQASGMRDVKESNQTYRLLDNVICECEAVTLGDLHAALAEAPDGDLNDLRRRTRLGMGTCQGSFCSFRSAAALCQSGKFSVERANVMLQQLVQERWKGVRPVLWGEQLREAEFMQAIYKRLLNLARLDAGGERV